MLICKPVATPMAVNEKFQLNDVAQIVDARLYQSLVGSLISLPHTWLNTIYPVSLISRFMHEPSKLQLAPAKQILHSLSLSLSLRHQKTRNEVMCSRMTTYWSITQMVIGQGLLMTVRAQQHVFCIGTKVISQSSRKHQIV